MSKTIEMDVAIIGAGSAGLTAYRAASKSGKRVLLIEAAQYGTTCARVGCMPSKLLIAAADRAHDMRNGDYFGIAADHIRIDGTSVMSRVRAERDRFAGFAVRSTEQIPQADRIMGRAHFTGNNTLALADGTRIQAGAVVIATGSHPHVPDQLRPAGDRLIVNDDVFEWHDLPGSVAVFGAGVVGLELGQALTRMGVRTRLFARGGNIGPLQDPEIQAQAHKLFTHKLAFDPDATVKSVQRVKNGVDITFLDRTTEQLTTENFDYVLAATGRRPNIAALELENTDLSLNKHGLPTVDPLTLQCGELPIFMAGDANDQRPLLHEAADEGRIAGTNAARYPDIQPGHRRTPLSVVFSNPQIAQVGLTYSEAQAACSECVIIGEASFRNQGRARIMGINEGLLHVYVRQGSGELLGAEMLAPAAEHLAHLLAWAISSRQTVSDLLAMPFYHPVIEEGLRGALRQAHDQLDPESPCGDPTLECGPGT